MAFLIADAGGKSNAKTGDYVVTGGGVYQKTSNGSIRVSGLGDLIGKDTTTNYRDVQNAYNAFVNKYNGGGDTGGKSSNTTVTSGTSQPSATVNGVDPNGIVAVAVDGYDPYAYAASYGGTSGSGSSSGLNKVFGAVILGLIGLAILDRFVGGGKK